jgi:hypothetical protein
MNNFFAYKLAVKQIKEGVNLTNTKVMWLLLNVTFIY